MAAIICHALSPLFNHVGTADVNDPFWYPTGTYKEDIFYYIFLDLFILNIYIYQLAGDLLLPHTRNEEQEEEAVRLGREGGSERGVLKVFTT